MPREPTLQRRSVQPVSKCPPSVRVRPSSPRVEHPVNQQLPRRDGAFRQFSACYLRYGANSTEVMVRSAKLNVPCPIASRAASRRPVIAAR